MKSAVFMLLALLLMITGWSLIRASIVHGDDGSARILTGFVLIVLAMSSAAISFIKMIS